MTGEPNPVLLEMLAELEALQQKIKHNRLAHYAPYPKQIEFHTAGATFRERLLMAGNQLGKTTSGGAEAAIHATGRYPDYWKGHRFDRPTNGWVGAPTGELARDGAQTILFGRPGELGTGMIPAECIIEKPTAGRGTQDLIDYALIRHVSGGTSRIKIKMYNQGRIPWQSETVDWVWFDEEPPADIYSEGITRTNKVFGPVWLTFTPLKGMSIVVAQFLRNPTNDRVAIKIAIDEVPFYSAEQREKIIASYPAHERDARARGVPMLGSGAIFPVADELVIVNPFQLPSHFAVLGGVDFGWEHPFAATKLAHDRDADVVYVTNEYKIQHATPAVHVAALKPWGEDLRFAWPHDGLQHDKGSGEQLAKQYYNKGQGLRMLAERATFTDGTSNVEPGLVDMLSRMETGRWKVFESCTGWLDERRLYRREEGKVVKEFDDLISSSRYALMMLRYARPPERESRRVLQSTADEE